MKPRKESHELSDNFMSQIVGRQATVDSTAISRLEDPGIRFSRFAQMKSIFIHKAAINSSIITTIRRIAFQ